MEVQDMCDCMNISDSTKNLIKEAEYELEDVFKHIDEVCDYNSLKVINSFKKNKLSETHFNSTTGYGYNDIGREIIEKIYADIFNCEDALVRSQFISGSHALSVTLFALLRPNDTLLSITGLPYDTLHEVIGIKDNNSSLKSFEINYEQIDLVNNDFDYDKIEDIIKNKKIKVIEIQRSKGYSTRKSLTLDKVANVIKFIKDIDPNIIIMIDNCYCEFVDYSEPTDVGADIVVGSLIKNLGGGIAPNGAYVVGKRNLIELVGERLTLPGEGREVGPTLGINKSILQGLFMAPSVVASALKTASLTSYCMEKLGYDVEPKYMDERADIVQNIIFHNELDLIKYCQGIQSASPVDSYVVPMPWDMPGYDDKVIMAAGAFTQGSSIELSCDGPIREPFIAYQQGGLTYQYGKIGVMSAIEYLKNK
ncbi:MAG: methionine gamma-lyase family protein [Bacilli bacterium]|nr:methionine gamma-lyase family protein [Bacilli bacterium]